MYNIAMPCRFTLICKLKTLLSLQLYLFAIPPSMLLYQNSPGLPLSEQSLHCTSQANLIKIVCSTHL